MKVLVLESGAARHNLRKQIPAFDLIVTNYALLRRDLEELQKFSFRAVILDEGGYVRHIGEDRHVRNADDSNPDLSGLARDALCPCGSGKMFKHCHGALASEKAHGEKK